MASIRTWWRVLASAGIIPIFLDHHHRVKAFVICHHRPELWRIRLHAVFTQGALPLKWSPSAWLQLVSVCTGLGLFLYSNDVYTGLNCCLFSPSVIITSCQLSECEAGLQSAELFHSSQTLDYFRHRGFRHRSAGSRYLFYPIWYLNDLVSLLSLWLLSYVI